jgi:hypothetical protein
MMGHSKPAAAFASSRRSKHEAFDAANLAGLSAAVMLPESVDCPVILL